MPCFCAEGGSQGGAPGVSWPQWGATAAVGWEGAGINPPPHVPRAQIFARFPQFLTFFTRLLGVGTPGVAPCVPQGGGPPAPWHFGVCTLSPPQPVRLPPSRSPHPAVPEPCKYLGDGASVPPCAPQNPFWALEPLTATSAGGKLRHGGCWARTQGLAPMGARSLWATPAPFPLGWGWPRSR